MLSTPSFFADVAGVAATIQGARSGSTPLTPEQVQDIMETNAELLSSFQGFPRLLVTTVGGCMGPTPAPTPAPPCLTGELKVTILTDNYPAETSWTVKNTCTDTTFMSGGSYSTAATTYVSEKCLPSVGRYEFNIEVRVQTMISLCTCLYQPFLTTKLNIYVIGHFTYNFRTLGVTAFAAGMAVAITKLNIRVRL